MESYKINDTPRDLTFSWKDFELMLEALHNFVDESTTKLPKEEVTELANRLTLQWHSKDLNIEEERSD